MKRNTLLFLLFTVTCVQLYAGDENMLTDFYNQTKISYVSKYKDLKNNPFNLFDEISVNYPVIGDYAEANNKLYYYCVPYLETDSFKLELLQRAKIASGIFLSTRGNETDYPQYVYNNRLIFLPTLKDVDFRFVFLFDGVLAVNITYSYTIGTSGERLDETFKMEKELLVRLRDGQVTKPGDLITPNKRNAFKSDIEKRIRKYAATHKPENDEEETIDGDDETDIHTPDIPKATEIVLNELVFTFTPFGVVVHIPAYSVNSSGCYGQSADLAYTPAELKPFLDAGSPLKNFISFGKIYSTPLKQINLYKETQFSHWRGEYSPQNDNSIFVTAPAGVKAINYAICYKNQHDSMAQLQRIRLFDDSGKLKEEQYFNNGKNKMSGNKRFEYNAAGQLLKITENTEQRNKSIHKTFRYDAAGNLVERKETGSDGESVTYRYVFDNLTVFEITEGDEPDDEGTPIREYHLTPNGKIINWCNFGEQPSYQSFYDGNRLLGSPRIKLPTLDNSVYAYDRFGKLLTIQEDNNRHLYEFSYNMNGQLTQLIHMDSRQIKNRWVYEYNIKGLRSTCTVYSNIYGYTNADNTYRYLITYDFY